MSTRFDPRGAMESFAYDNRKRGGFFQLVPSLGQGALPPPIVSVRPYTPLELTGRDIPVREGCSGCHTQLVRTLLAVLPAPRLYTPYSATEIANADADARKQVAVIAAEPRQQPALTDKSDLEIKEVIALIAYPKRLGRDLHHPQPTTSASGR